MFSVAARASAVRVDTAPAAGSHSALKCAERDSTTEWICPRIGTTYPEWLVSVSRPKRLCGRAHERLPESPRTADRKSCSRDRRRQPRHGLPLSVLSGTTRPTAWRLRRCPLFAASRQRMSGAGANPSWAASTCEGWISILPREPVEYRLGGTERPTEERVSGGASSPAHSSRPRGVCGGHGSRLADGRVPCGDVSARSGVRRAHVSQRLRRVNAAICQYIETLLNRRASVQRQGNAGDTNAPFDNGHISPMASTAGVLCYF